MKCVCFHLLSKSTNLIGKLVCEICLMNYIYAALKVISVRIELSLRTHYLRIRLSVCPFFRNRWQNFNFFFMKLGHHLTKTWLNQLFEKKCCFWFLGQKDIKWTQYSTDSIQIVPEITRVEVRFLLREYLHPKVDQPDSMSVICSLLHTKKNIEIYPILLQS